METIGWRMLSITPSARSSVFSGGSCAANSPSETARSSESLIATGPLPGELGGFTPEGRPSSEYISLLKKLINPQALGCADIPHSVLLLSRLLRTVLLV